MIGQALLVLVAGSGHDVSTERAQQFLTAFVQEPSKSKPWFTKDAVVIFGDIGGTVTQALPVLKSGGAWMTTCRVGRIEHKTAPSLDEMKDAPPRLKGGVLAVFEGEYLCTRTDNPNTKLRFSVSFKGDRVVMLALGEGPKHD